jgi:2-polyprenyl-6-methoxyphenol hydroxylase-like FAD-dependent oxidoreductase
MRRIEVPVLVVGAGPVGMTASILLARQGIGNLVVDRRSGPHRAPQAHVVNPRSLEIFRGAGLDVAVLRTHATPREDGSHVAWMTTLAGTELGRLPYERQGDDALAYSPTPLLNLSQHRLEPLLLSHLRTHPLATLHYRHEWASLTQDEDSVTARIRDLDHDEDYEVRCKWLLAADGAGSRVRRAVDIGMEGPDRLQSFVMIHFEANLRPLVRERPAILYWTVDPECLGAFVAHDIDRTWVFMHAHDPETEPIATFTEAACTAIVRRAIGHADVDFVVRDISSWTMTAQVAERYRAGNVFLVGDSAHRFPPSGGMGMNTGVQDVHNLAWKLAAVAQGWADGALLDTYERERRPIAQRNADQSLANAMKMLELLQELGITPDDAASRPVLAALLADADGRARVHEAIARQQDHFDMLGLQLGLAYESGALVPDGSDPAAPANPVRDYLPTARPGARLPHAWIEQDGERRSTLDLVAAGGLTLISAPDGGAWAEAARACTQGPVRCLVSGRDFHDPEGHWTRACELAPDGAVLVRPDQHVAWRASTAPVDAAAMLREVVRVISGSATAPQVNAGRRPRRAPTAARP